MVTCIQFCVVGSYSLIPGDKSSLAMVAFNIFASTSEWNYRNEIKREKFGDLTVPVRFACVASGAVKVAGFNGRLNAPCSKNNHSIIRLGQKMRLNILG